MILETQLCKLVALLKIPLFPKCLIFIVLFSPHLIQISQELIQRNSIFDRKPYIACIWCTGFILSDKIIT